MKLLKILNFSSFQDARIIFYILLIVEYIYFAYFSNFKCIGCPLCGMTRAVKSLLKLNFSLALQYNKNVWIFFIILPLIVIDIFFIIRQKLLKNDLSPLS